MKGFIEVVDTQEGTTLINVNYIISVKPLMGLNITGETAAYSELDVYTTKGIKVVRAKEQYYQIKELVETALN